MLDIPGALTDLAAIKALADAAIAKLTTSPPPPSAPVITSLTVNPSSVLLGQSATVAWGTQGATAVTLSGPGFATPLTVPPTGTQPVTPPAAGIASYGLSASGAGVTVNASVDLTVSSPPPPPPQTPTGSLSLTPPTILVGQSSVLAWTSANGVPTLNGAPLSPPSGSQNVSPLVDTTYALVVAGAQGTQPFTQNATLIVTQPPPPPPPGTLPPAPADQADDLTITTASIVSHHDTVPNFGANPTRSAVQSGSWSSPATWGGTLPTANDVIAIGSGKNVEVDAVIDTKHNVIAVQAGGVLRFRVDADTRLRVTTLLVMPSGILMLGTATDPIPGAIKAELFINDVPLDTTADPAQYGHGLLVWGTIRSHGEPKTSFARLANVPLAGQAVLTFASPVVGWRPGDRLAIADTRQLQWGSIPGDGTSPGYSCRSETVLIETVAANGLSVTLTTPLQWDHPGAKDGAGNYTFKPHAANLTCNVKIASENSSGVRGHTSYYNRADVELRNTQFAGLGRTRNDLLDNTTFNAQGVATHVGTNQIGRYPLHIHHLRGPSAAPATGYQFVVEGCVSVCLMNAFVFKWGLTIHDSSFGKVADNVVWNWAGAGLAIEEGGETQNLIARNFIGRVQGTGSRADARGSSDTGHEGAGFWTRSADNLVVDNVVADCRHGYVVWPDGLTQIRRPNAPGLGTHDAGDYQTIDPRQQPLRQFERNEVYGGVCETGLDFWSLMTDGYGRFPSPQESVVKDFKLWHVWQYGYYNYKTERITFDGLVARGDYAQITAGNGRNWMFYAGDYAAYNFKVVNSDIQGFLVGYECSAMGDQRVQDTYMRNHQNLLVTPMWWLGSADLIPPRTFTASNVTHGVFSGPNQGYTGPKGWLTLYGPKRGQCTTLIAGDAVLVDKHNGQLGANYRLYYAEAAAGAILPQRVGSPGFWTLWACPVAGLTNAQAWAQYGVAFGGTVAPTGTTTLSNVSGLVETLP